MGNNTRYTSPFAFSSEQLLDFAPTLLLIGAKLQQMIVHDIVELMGLAPQTYRKLSTRLHVLWCCVRNAIFGESPDAFNGVQSSSESCPLQCSLQLGELANSGPATNAFDDLVPIGMACHPRGICAAT